MDEKGGRSYSALVVDDEIQLRELISEFLEMEGYKVSSASDPVEALELAKDNHFDIILTDLKMPGMGGIELLRRVRKYHPYIATIVFTGFGTPEAVVQAFRDGRVNDFLAKPFQAPELYRAVSLAIKEQSLKEREDHFYRELEQRVKEVTKELEDKNKLLEQLSITDDLTTLYNQRHFYTMLEREVERAKRQRYDLALLLMDIDNFKKFNDIHGHKEGDMVLHKMGEVVKGCIRENVDTACRYGGEEFTVILPNATEEQAQKVAERVARGFENLGFTTVSVGLVVYRPEYSLDNFVRLADEAMYMAKRAGGNRVSVYPLAQEEN